MTPQDITRLGEIRDELYSIAERANDPDDSRSTAPAQVIRRSSHALQDAIDELMLKAAEKYGVKVKDIRVMRPSRRLAA